MQELLQALYRFENALSLALINHYCRTMAEITGRQESELRAEVLDERDRLIALKQSDSQRL